MDDGLERAIVDELVGYYLLEDLPRTFDERSVAELTRDSAQRLLDDERVTDRSRLVRTLDAMASDRNHKLTQEISDLSEYGWARTDDRWQELRMILRALVRHLEPS